MEIKLFSDIVCPFCYIAEATIIPALIKNHNVSFLRLGMELHPKTPPGGVDISDERYAPFRAYVEQYARSFNMDGIRLPEKTYNTRKFQLVAEAAREQGRLDIFWQAGMEAYWKEQAPLDDDTVLEQLATLSGMPSGSVRAALDNMAFALRLDKRRYNALKLGVQTLPAFMWGRQAILGCQPLETFRKAFQKNME
ncbi:MAG: hypothetical protein D6677_10310 [Calditrichaeota bacterium]|nr:MAG: hypothetical protein D6677_10310 [Calditrichota bacterium]